MYLSGEGNSIKEAPVAKATSPQAMRGAVLICRESLEYDPNVVDLILGRVKRCFCIVEARRELTDK